MVLENGPIKIDQMDLSKLYIDEDGFLMCGEPGRSTSMVESFKLLPINIDNPRKFDYEIICMNDLGWPCQGYAKKCDSRFKITESLVETKV